MSRRLTLCELADLLVKAHDRREKDPSDEAAAVPPVPKRRSRKPVATEAEAVKEPKKRKK
jgi:hypothetical protein